MFPSDTDFESKITMETDSNVVAEELPFHLLMLGDWSGNFARTDLSKRRPIEIDRDNFDEVIRNLKVSLELDLYDDGTTILPLNFTGIDDFHPDQLYQQVQLFADLRDLRQRLLNPDTFNVAAREVRSFFIEMDEVEATNAETQTISNETHLPNSNNLLDQILSQSSENTAFVSSQATDKTELGRLLERLVKPHLVRIDEIQQSELLAVVDAATSDLMRAILHHKHFQQLEAAWRGLYFLVRRVETDSELKIYILDISKDELTDNLKSINSLTDSLIYHWAITETQDNADFEPWSVISGNYAFNLDVEDIATLIRLARICDTANAPFISHIKPQVLGITSFAETPNPEDWNLSTETPEGKLWTTLRSLPESAYLGLTIPRFLVRLPYGSETDPLERFSFEELSDEPEHDQYLWANTCFACTLLLAQSFCLSGWEMGHSLIHDIEGLPVHIYQNNGEKVVKPSTEVVTTLNACEVILEHGLMPLISFRDNERVRLMRFQSIASPLSALRGRWS